MRRWAGRVAVVTGASSGIGAAIAQELVKNGLKVAGLARRVERVQELQNSLKFDKGELFPIKCDVTSEKDIKKAFATVKEKWGGVDILVNNAGIGLENTLSDGPAEHWKGILDLNILGLSVCTKEALQSMKERGVDDGHIVHINSILGHTMMDGSHMYAATKHAVTVLTEGLRRELVKQKSKIRVTSVSPGVVKTEFLTTSKMSLTPEELYKIHPSLESKDIADAVLYAIGVPPHVQVHEIIIKPVGETF